eukprot:CFRG5022T1
MGSEKNEFDIDFQKLQESAFEKNKEDGLSSETFNIDANIKNNTHVGGLKDTESIKRLQAAGLTFDQARLELTRQRMVDNGIDPITGLPLDDRAFYETPMIKVSIYRERNMIHSRVADVEGDDYIGKAKTIEEAVELAVSCPSARGFTWHSPTLRNKWAGRCFAWSETRMLIASRLDPLTWHKQAGHISGIVERPEDDGVAKRLPSLHVKAFKGLNMVHGRVKDRNGDGYCGVAKTIREAAYLAIQVPNAKFFTWHHPQDWFAGDWATRVYAWTEERAKEAGREDSKQWIHQSDTTSGTIELQYAAIESVIMNPYPQLPGAELTAIRVTTDNEILFEEPSVRNPNGEKKAEAVVDDDMKEWDIIELHSLDATQARESGYLLL